MYLNHLIEEGELDREWVELIYQAKSIGLTLEEIRKFILDVLESRPILTH